MTSRWVGFRSNELRLIYRHPGTRKRRGRFCKLRFVRGVRGCRARKRVPRVIRANGSDDSLRLGPATSFSQNLDYCSPSSIRVRAPVWPATGFAFAAVLLFGLRVWPALFLAAFLANVTTSGLVLSSLAIGAGNTLEAVALGFAVTRWSEGAATFESPAGVARFAVISLLVATPISATIGVGSLWVLGQTTTASFGTVWTTWWLGDVGGALVVTPALVLWFRHKCTARDVWNFAPLYAAAGLVGLLAFSPIVAQPMRDLLPFLAIVPLLWAALRQGPRDTATVALILSVFAVWGTLEAEGPFARVGLNKSFLLTLAFVSSAALPSLILSADVAMRQPR